MAAYDYAMDAVLYMTTGMLDRHDEDIQVETALCKVFCSEYGWRVVNDAIQIMGGESYMTENEVERVFRDSPHQPHRRGRQRGHAVLHLRLRRQAARREDARRQERSAQGQGRVLRQEPRQGIKNLFNPKIMAAIPLGWRSSSAFAAASRPSPRSIPRCVHTPSASAAWSQEHTYQFKVMSKRYDEKMLERQAVQARLADMRDPPARGPVHARQARRRPPAHGSKGNGADLEFERDKAAGLHFFDLAECEIHDAIRSLYDNADDTMLKAAEAARLKHGDTLPNAQFIISERSPNAKGTGRTPSRTASSSSPATGPASSSRPRPRRHAGHQLQFRYRNILL
jgi:acyl-CoA dehydrogenase family protein 9